MLKLATIPVTQLKYRSNSITLSRLLSGDMQMSSFSYNGGTHVTNEGNRIVPTLYSGNARLVASCTLIVHKGKQNSAQGGSKSKTKK